MYKIQVFSEIKTKSTNIIFAYSVPLSPNRNLPQINVSFSRCSSTGSSKAFVVTMPTRNKKNTCQLNFTQKLELKMTSPTACVKDTLPQDFKDILTKNLILAVNKKKSCGFSWNMINGKYVLFSFD